MGWNHQVCDLRPVNRPQVLSPRLWHRSTGRLAWPSCLVVNGLQSSGTDSEALIAPVVRDSDKPALDCSPRRPIGTVSGPARGSLTQPRRRPGGPLASSCQYPVARARVSGPRTGHRHWPSLGPGPGAALLQDPGPRPVTGK
jgi:hypothetical protein